MTEETWSSLTDQIVVVTGATGAIGRATVAAFRDRGATVVALGRDPERLAALWANGIPTWSVDARDADALAGVAAEVRERVGPASVLLPFAGGDGFPVPTTEETPQHWRAVVDNELTSTFLTIQAFLPDLLTHGASTVVTMSSAAALRAGRSNAAYAAAKAGIIGLTRHLAGELKDRGVRVNCLAPSAVANDRIDAMPAPQREAMAKHLPLGRIGCPEDVARAALYLGSAASAYTSGVVLDLGGTTL